MDDISRIGDSGNQAGEVDLLDILHIGNTDPSPPGAASQLYVTPVRTVAPQQLKLILWRVTSDGSTITRISDTGTQAGDITLVSGIRYGKRRLITAVRGRDSGRLKLILWEVSSDGDEIIRLADTGLQAGSVDQLRINELYRDEDQGDRLVTTVRSADTKRMRLILWRVSPDGTAITRVGADDHAVGGVDLISAAEAGGFASGGGQMVLTAVRGHDGQRLKLISWRITDDDNVIRVNDSGDQAGDVNLISMLPVNIDEGTLALGKGVITAVRGNSNRLRLIGWRISPVTGSIERLSDSDDQAGDVDMVAFGDRRFGSLASGVTVVRSSNTGRMKIIDWKYVLPAITATFGDLEYDFMRIRDSGQQAGRVDLLACAPAFHPNVSSASNFDLVTAVKGTESRRLRLITWRLKSS